MRGRSSPENCPEVRLAMLAKTHARAGPAVAEDAVDPVEGDDFPGDLGHELEVVGPERTGDPQLRIRPVLAPAPLSVHGDPVWMRVVDVLMSGVWIGARDDVHPERATAGNELTERVAIAKEPAAMVERDFRRVVGHAPAGRQAGRVGVSALEVIEPELRVVLAGVVLDERQLCPSHRLVVPAGGRRLCRMRGEWKRSRGHRRGRQLQELASVRHGYLRAAGAATLTLRSTGGIP